MCKGYTFIFLEKATLNPSYCTKLYSLPNSGKYFVNIILYNTMYLKISFSEKFKVFTTHQMVNRQTKIKIL